MCAQLYRVGEPYKLKGHRLSFANWHNVRPGQFTWHDAQGRDVTVRGNVPADEATIRRKDFPWGVNIRVNEGIRTAPLFPRDAPWEEGGYVLNTILKDGDVYKAWASTSWMSSFPNKGNRFILYYESRDGIVWERYSRGLVEFEGSRNNNIIYDGRAQGGIQHGGAVFIDSSSTSERFKMVCETMFTPAECTRYLADRSRVIEAIANKGREGYMGIQGAVSADGIHWTVLPDPLLLCIADTQVVGYYDEQRKKYVVYSRELSARAQANLGALADAQYVNSWGKSVRRAINRSESSDFRRFSLPQLVAEAAPDMPPTHTLYANCRTTYPGAPEEHLMFPMVYTVGETDSTYGLLYSSIDGICWNRVSPKPVIRCAPYGEWDGGTHLFITPNLIETANGDFALPYTGWNVPHKYPRDNATRAVAYNVWPKGRLVGIEARERGEFTTVSIIPPGRRAYLNAMTERAGGVRVEACDFSGEPLPNRSFADSVAIAGDAHRTAIRWQGADDLGVAAGEPVVLRFKIELGTIYSVDFD